MEYLMKHLIIILLVAGGLLNTMYAFSQTQNTSIRKGNQFYKQGDYDKSLAEYERAVQLNPSLPVANFNLGNVLFRKERWADAEKSYDNVLAKSTVDSVREKAFYNKGVSLTKQKKLEESIEAYKSALKLTPDDEDARINLQKALLERKKNESQQKEQRQEKPKQKEKPKPQQSKLNKREVEQLLKALRQREQEVQQKMQNKPRGVTPPEKDW
jgi:tetratricopeptide (TPR) repeat protein